MNNSRLINSLAVTIAFVAGVCGAPAQQSFYEQFRQHNTQMKDVQPSWMGPLTHCDARLGQGIKISVSKSDFPPSQPIVYGNNKGMSVVVDRRFQLDFNPPSFFRDHSSVQKDGFGNAGSQVKCRIASGNADHGNFAATAILFHGFAPRAIQNQILSAFYVPSLAAGKAFGRFVVISTVGGFLPTAKIAAQGRTVEWNLTAQTHVGRRFWFDVENNATFDHAGPDDGMMQNLITPAAFYQVSRKLWPPQHSMLVFDCGMQTATSRYHAINHNLITEMRIAF